MRARECGLELNTDHKAFVLDHRFLVDSEDFQHEKHLVLRKGYDSESSGGLVLDFTPYTSHDHFR